MRPCLKIPSVSIRPRRPLKRCRRHAAAGEGFTLSPGRTPSDGVAFNAPRSFDGGVADPAPDGGALSSPEPTTPGAPNCCDCLNNEQEAHARESFASGESSRDAFPGCGYGGRSGSLMVKVAPRPTPALSARMLPPWAAVIDFAIAKPTPEPP